MVTEGVPVPYCCDDVERTTCSDINGLVPPRVEVAVDNASLCQTFLVLVSEHHIWIAEAVYVAGFEILSFDDLDGEDVGGGLLLSRRLVALNDLGAGIDVDLLFKLVELMCSMLDVVQFDKRL